jgi:prepilin-type N-terminal cleavage/methylation domain-containing protein
MGARGLILARSRPGLTSKAGFTLLEMLIVLAIMSLTAAMVIPRIGATLDQAVSKTEAFKFQQQVMDLRRQTFHEEQAVQVVESGQFVDDPAADPRPAELRLGAGWTYRLSDPLIIDAGGICSTTTVQLFSDGRPAGRLQGGAACRFDRVLS